MLMPPSYFQILSKIALYYTLKVGRSKKTKIVGWHGRPFYATLSASVFYVLRECERNYKVLCQWQKALLALHPHVHAHHLSIIFSISKFPSHISLCRLSLKLTLCVFVI